MRKEKDIFIDITPRGIDSVEGMISLLKERLTFFENRHFIFYLDTDNIGREQVVELDKATGKTETISLCACLSMCCITEGEYNDTAIQ